MSGLCGRQVGRLFSNQVIVTQIDWQAAVSIDSPLHPSVSQPAEALTQDGDRRQRREEETDLRGCYWEIHSCWPSPPSDTEKKMLKSI